MRSLLFAMFVLLAAGCTEKVPVPPAPAQGLAGLLGNWTVKLSPKQDNDLKTMNLVFEAEEPSPELLATLTPQERVAITSMRTARKRSPDDPQFMQMRAVIQGMGGSRLTITTSSMSLTIGQVHQAAQISVTTETSTAVTVNALMHNGKSESVQFVIDGPDAIRMARPGQTDALTFVRVRK